MEPVPVDRWGKDHWSTLAYIETCCVDKDGVGGDGVAKVDHRRMRCNPDRHPPVGKILGEDAWDETYGTRLKGYFADKDNPDLRLQAHDDWDCVDDMEAAGMAEVISFVNGFVRLTDKGLDFAQALRRHKAAGSHYAYFEVTDELRERWPELVAEGT